MLAPDCQKLLRLLSMGGEPGRIDDASTKRVNFRKLLAVASGRAPDGIAAADRQLATPAGAIGLRLYRRDDLPTMPQPLPTCVFFHGGGFVAGSIETHDSICRALAHASGWQVASVGYRLAPECSFPAPVEDGLAVLDAIDRSPASFGAMPGRIAVAGDSVGAGLAAYICQQWHAKGRRPLVLQVLICPALDPVPRFPSRQVFARGFYIEDHMIESDFDAYRGMMASLPTVFDAADLSNMPPAIIHVAGCDPFHDEGIAYGVALEKADVAVQVSDHAEMLHLFHAFTKFIPAGADALRTIGGEMSAVASVV